MKQYVALARVSSREQEREGFSLEIQEDALHAYAQKNGGSIRRLFKIAETATKRDQRQAFKELLAFAKKHAADLDGILFYKVDRAARNLIDYVELERLESDYHLPFISVSQPMENNPAGRMMRRTLANMASFYTEQMAVDISQGINRRVQEGYFPGRAPYGYRNIRVDGRSIVEVDSQAASNVRRIFSLYAFERLTLEAVVDRLAQEGAVYRPENPRFNRTTIHNFLNDRAYLGEIQYRGKWYPGKHEPIIDLTTWTRVRELIGKGNQQAHQMTFADEFMQCGHCGHQITGELKTKRLKSGTRSYQYYRCSRYNQLGHPRVRVTEADIASQLLEIFARMRLKDDSVREWFRAVLIAQSAETEQLKKHQRAELERQLSVVEGQVDRLLNLRIDGAIDEATFTKKQTELRDRLGNIKSQMRTASSSDTEFADLVMKVFELSQNLTDKWLTADYSTKRRILDIVCLNCKLVDTTLVPVMRKPFDMIAEGLLVPQSGG